MCTPIIKGVGKVNGDGWKDTTKVGEIVFCANTELPAPYAPGQFPRIGYVSWTASTDQYDFQPSTLEELSSHLFDQKLAAAAERETLLEAIRMAAQALNNPQGKQARLRVRSKLLQAIQKTTGEQTCPSSAANLSL
jgi:hypothetical protein